MCDEPVPCACTRERRRQLRGEHISRFDKLRGLASRLSRSDQITDDEMMLLYEQADREWDDAIHIASPDDPLRSLCGAYGRNLVDLPKRPDGDSGCWGCLTIADELTPSERELVTA